MKVLSIGNSFSEDAQRWLNSISKISGQTVDTVNLMIGGCTLERHYNNILGNKSDYSLEGNGLEYIKQTSIDQAMREDAYDIITVQQASGFSGKPQSYIPYLTEIVKYIRKKQPDARICFHKTWSYEIDSNHGHFAFYNNDQNEMYRRINDCAEMVKELANIEIIHVGDFIQYLRENTNEFNYKNGGISLCRDGFHLSETYGRFAAAAVWYKEFTGKFADTQKFASQHQDFDANLLDVIINSMKDFYAKQTF